MTVSTLTLLVLRIGFLLLMWLFVFAIVYALRSDLFGPRARKKAANTARSPFQGVPTAQPAAAAGAAASPSAPAPPVDTEHPLAGLARDMTGSIPRQQPRPFPASSASPVQPATGTSNRPMATVLTAGRIVITSGPREGTEIPLTNEPLTIGRSSDSGLVIRDDYTSTHHARLMLWNNEWMIQDLDSTNGTFLGDKRVTVPTQLPLSTPVRIGQTTFELRR
jgi:hypothetical protein